MKRTTSKLCVLYGDCKLQDFKMLEMAGNADGSGNGELASGETLPPARLQGSRSTQLVPMDPQIFAKPKALTPFQKEQTGTWRSPSLWHFPKSQSSFSHMINWKKYPYTSLILKINCREGSLKVCISQGQSPRECTKLGWDPNLPTNEEW